MQALPWLLPPEAHVSFTALDASCTYAPPPLYLAAAPVERPLYAAAGFGSLRASAMCPRRAATCTR